ncbi:MAG: HIT domain-containing protein [bacterium]|nr:HIT domain-containing protein [bacterium]
MNQDNFYQPDCILCQLVKGQLPSKKVVETDEFLAIHDKYPRARIDVLIIDKKHRVKKDTVFGRYKGDGYWDKVFEAVSLVIKKMGLDKAGYKIVILGAGLNHFEHEHIHVMSGD